MKNWKKLLACLLVGLMALTVFTACDASVGAPMEPQSSTADSAKELCDKIGKDYSKELSDKAYMIADWVASSSVSCKVKKDALYREGNANTAARAYLEKEQYASAFEALSMGSFGPNDFVPGFDIKTPEWSSKDDSITFVLPKDGTVTKTMTKAAAGKNELGVAYVEKGGVSYAVVLFG